jgi:hypothetical protein
MANNPTIESLIGGRLGSLAPGALDKRIRPNAPAAPSAEQKDALAQTTNVMETKDKLGQLQAQETGSAFDVLKSPEFLIKAGLALAGGLSGNQNLQALGLGLGTGALMGAPAEAEQEFMQHQNNIQNMQDMLIKQQGQIMKLVQERPNLFVDENEENIIDPEVWRQTLGIEVNPAAAVKRLTQSKRLEEQIKFLSRATFTAAENGRTEAALTLAGEVTRLVGLDVPPQALAGLVSSKDHAELVRGMYPYASLSSLKDMIDTWRDNPGTELIDYVYLLDEKKEPQTAEEKRALRVEKAQALVRMAHAEMSDEEKKYYAQNPRELYRTVLAQDFPTFYAEVKDDLQHLDDTGELADLRVAQVTSLVESASIRYMARLLGLDPKTMTKTQYQEKLAAIIAEYRLANDTALQIATDAGAARQMADKYRDRLNQGK